MIHEINISFGLHWGAFSVTPVAYVSSLCDVWLWGYREC